MGLTGRSYRPTGEHISVRTVVLLALLAGTFLAGSAEGHGHIRNNKRTYDRLGSEINDEQLGTMKTFRESLAALSPDIPKIFLDDGDVITCVPIENQLSLTNISNPKIQLKPSSAPSDSSPRSTAYPGIEVAQQIYQLNSVICPVGMYPLRTSRSTFPAPPPNETLPAFSPAVTTQDADLDDVQEASSRHEHAYAELNGEFKGVQVSVNVWQPQVENQPNIWNFTDFSLAQLWVVSFDFLSGVSTIEVGWQVFKSLYGDLKPRLFIYWTADDYFDTGCYNLDCPGFVQVSNKVLVGGAIEGISTIDGTQYELDMRVFQDPETHNWWLQLNDDYLGYFPSTLFPDSLNEKSDQLQWGGEVFGFETTDVHYGTKMGSGAFPDAGFKRAAYMRNMKYVNMANEWQDAKAITLDTDTSLACYTASRGSPNVMDFQTWGVSFFFGGPGHSDICLGSSDSYY